MGRDGLRIDRRRTAPGGRPSHGLLWLPQRAGAGRTRTPPLRHTLYAGPLPLHWPRLRHSSYGHRLVRDRRTPLPRSRCTGMGADGFPRRLLPRHTLAFHQPPEAGRTHWRHPDPHATDDDRCPHRQIADHAARYARLTDRSLRHARRSPPARLHRRLQHARRSGLVRLWHPGH